MEERIKTNSFGSRSKLLLINEEFIRFDQKTLNIGDVTGIIYWVSPIIVYRFAVGWKFHIGLRTHHDHLDIVFRSFFGLSHRYFKKLCKRILNIVWDPITDKILKYDIETLKAGKLLDHDYCQLNDKGIFISQKQVFIPWDDLLYEKKYDRLVLNSKTNHTNWSSFEFGKYWNVDVLIALLDWLFTAGGLREIQYQDKV